MDIHSTVIAIMTENYGVTPEQANSGANLEDLGMDSFTLTEFSLAIKARLGARITSNEISKYSTVQDVTDAVQAATSANAQTSSPQ